MTDDRNKLVKMNVRANRASGFSLLEMTVTMLISSILMVGVSGVIVGAQKGWNDAYRRVYGQVVTDAYMARRVFDKVVRKASIKKCVVGLSNDDVEVYYYDSPASTHPDRYARFYYDGSNLMLEYGQLEPGTFDYANNNSPTTQTLAQNVTGCYFAQSTICLHMSLTLDDGRHRISAVVSSTRHNK